MVNCFMTNAASAKKLNDEIDFKEFFLNIWSYKILVFFISLLFTVISGFFALKLEKQYTASSKFIFNMNNSAGNFESGLSQQLGKLVPLAALTDSNTEIDLLIERMTSREFILEIASEKDLKNDDFFHKYDPNATDPLWKSLIKSIVGWESLEISPDRRANWNILKKFDSTVSIQQTDGGAIEVKVTHKNPTRAAEIANYIVEKIITLTKMENKENLNSRLQYLSEKLAVASKDLKYSQSRVNEFALKNSAQAVQSFAVGSVVLDDLRSKRLESLNQIKALKEIQKLSVKPGHLTQNDYTELRKNYPLVDDAGFRQTLGLPLNASSWLWPKKQTLDQVLGSVYDRISSLDAKIRKLETEASRYGASAEEYAEISRSLQIAEATYEVLIEQVKGQSLLAGYAPDTAKVIAVADIPVAPTKPQRTLILIIGLSLGIFLGSLTALILNARNRVYFSQSNLMEALSPKFSHKTGSLRRFKNQSLVKVQETLNKTPTEWPKQLLSEAATSLPKLAIIIDISTTNSAASVGRMVGVSGGDLNYNCALVDLSKSSSSISIPSAGGDDQFHVIEKVDSCTEYVYGKPGKTYEWIFSKSFKQLIGSLIEKHDFVMLTAESDVSEILMSAPLFKDTSLVVYAQKGKTAINHIEKLKLCGELKVALYA